MTSPKSQSLKILREYDIRGVTPTEIHPEFAYHLGRIYAHYLLSKNPNAQTVSVGRDCRLSGPALFESLTRGLLESGLNVIDVGLVPTPLVYFSAYQLPVEGSIMITGSHNPKDFNGFKMMIGHSTLFGSDIQKFSELYQNYIVTGKIHELQKRSETTHGQIRKNETLESTYLDYCSQNVKLGRKLKIVIDAGNGAGSKLAPLLFQKIGAEVIPLFCEFDGSFPNHHPDPTVPANLKALREKVLETQADFGVALDGDADRIGVCDDKGQILMGDEIMIVFAREVLKKNPGATIISEVKSSFRLYDDIKAHGGRGIMFKTGHSLIKNKMKEEKSLLAGEMSGHIFFADRYFGFDDAIYASLRFYEIASLANEPVSSWLKSLPKTFNTPEIRIDCVEETKFQIVEQVAEILPSLVQGGILNTIDGIRVDFDQSWGLLRASNTQAVLVMRFEAITQSRMDEIKAVFENALKQVATSLKDRVIISALSAS